MSILQKSSYKSYGFYPSHSSHRTCRTNRTYGFFRAPDTLPAGSTPPDLVSDSNDTLDLFTDGQVQLGPRPELDHAELLAAGQLLSFARGTDDPPGDGPLIWRTRSRSCGLPVGPAPGCWTR